MRKQHHVIVNFINLHLLMRFFLSICLTLTLGNVVFSQDASIQDCLGAIPVCQKIYTEDRAPIGSGNFVDYNGSNTCVENESNSIWYTFTVNESGMFGFLLTPENPLQDYDWILFDITNANCSDLFEDPSLIVSCNAAGNAGCEGPTGATGATTFSNQGPNCGTDPPTMTEGFSPFNDLIDVLAGNTYVLCILNFSADLSEGYTIDFGLSTDIGIFDETPPTIADISYLETCNGESINVQFSEYIQCATIAADNFGINGANGPYTLSMESVNCDAGGNYSRNFTLNISPPLEFGETYDLSLVTDGVSEVLDLCDNPASPMTIDGFSGPVLFETADLGPDTSICAGTTVSLSNRFTIAGGFSWSTGSFTPRIEVDQPGIYSLTITTACGPTADTIELISLGNGIPENILGTDTTICNNESITLDATFEDATYLWQDGSTNSTFLVNQPGNYAVTITNDCGDQIDEISITSANEIEATIDDQTICPGGSVTWDVTTPGATYLWSNGATTPIVNISEPGDYTVAITTSCGSIELEASIALVEEDIAPLDLGNDTTLCNGTSLTINLDPSSTSILWQDGSTASTYTINSPGTYSVTVTDVCGTASDTIIVNTQTPIQTSIGDTTLCEGATVTWDVTVPGAQYLWQDGSTDPTFTADEDGKFSVTIMTACETVTLNANVTYVDVEIPVVDLGPDRTLCNGETLTLSAPDLSNTNFIWQNGSTNNTFLVEQAGTYGLIATNECGQGGDSITINFVDELEVVNLQDTFLCPGESLLLDVTSQNATRYQWQNNSTDSTLLITAPGSYTVQVSNDCDQQTYSVVISPCSICELYVPNAFSPNGDGKNDHLIPFSNCNIVEFDLEVFDRWGNLVFKTQSIEEGWNGITIDQIGANGIYIYSIQAIVNANGRNETIQLSGDVALIK